MFESLSLFFLKIRLWVFLNPFLCVWALVFLNLLNIIYYTIWKDSSNVLFKRVSGFMVGLLSFCIFCIAFIILCNGLINAFNYDFSFLNTSYISELLDQGKLSLDEGHKILEFLQGNEYKFQAIFNALSFFLILIFLCFYLFCL